MKRLFFILTTFILTPYFLSAQSNFNKEDYLKHVEETQGINAESLQNYYPLKGQYYKGFEEDFKVSDYTYLDSIVAVYDLTPGEIDLIEENHFMVTERLSYNSYGEALYDIYKKDLPVMVTTDLVLHAVHKSYDAILKDLENHVMIDNLEQFCQGMYEGFHALQKKYGDASFQANLEQIDLYTTVALNLISEDSYAPQMVSQSRVDEVLGWVAAEEFKKVTLFSPVPMNTDFSQFKPRGHYEASGAHEMHFERYFRAMMWLGRMSFYLTPPITETPITPEQQKEVDISAFLLNELRNNSANKDLLEANNEIIDKLVGESDNMTPAEYTQLMSEQGINSATDFLDEERYQNFRNAIEGNPDFQQRIASFPYLTNPCDEDPTQLPVAYKLSGQRFIIDSYIMGSVVYDRIVHEGHKVFRPMPNPIDAMIVLGNNDGIDIMQDEIDEYHYGPNLTALRYLVDHQDLDFWTKSLYGNWVEAIRTLGKPENIRQYPLFMRTAAWQHQKINTQLASWTELRHDNLLYASQSYTGTPGCFYPHSFVEPYPAFYATLASFAKESAGFYRQLPEFTNQNKVVEYYENFEEVMDVLQTLAEKELNQEDFSESEIDFLQKMLHAKNMVCYETIDGWLVDLFYGGDEKATEIDYITADVHTQPADAAGNIIGHVLHVGTGKINLGVFLAEHPSCDQPVAFVGPVSSYYEYIEEDFKRMQDSEWSSRVWDKSYPERPDWTNIYLASNMGQPKEEGRELPAIMYRGENSTGVNDLLATDMDIYPNPASEFLQVSWEDINARSLQIDITNINGQLVYSQRGLSAQKSSLQVNLKDWMAGAYMVTLRAGNKELSKKVIVY